MASHCGALVVFRRLWFPQQRSIRGQGDDRCRRCRVPSGRCGLQTGVRCWHEDGQRSGGRTDRLCGKRARKQRAPTTTPPPVTLALARPAPFDSFLLYSCQSLPLVELTLRRRIKSHLLFAGIIRSSQFSPR